MGEGLYGGLSSTLEVTRVWGRGEARGRLHCRCVPHAHRQRGRVALEKRAGGRAAEPDCTSGPMGCGRAGGGQGEGAAGRVHCVLGWRLGGREGGGRRGAKHSRAGEGATEEGERTDGGGESKSAVARQWEGRGAALFTATHCPRSAEATQHTHTHTHTKHTHPWARPTDRAAFLSRLPPPLCKGLGGRGARGERRDGGGGGA